MTERGMSAFGASWWDALRIQQDTVLAPNNTEVKELFPHPSGEQAFSSRRVQDMPFFAELQFRKHRLGSALLCCLCCCTIRCTRTDAALSTCWARQPVQRGRAKASMLMAKAQQSVGEPRPETSLQLSGFEGLPSESAANAVEKEKLSCRIRGFYPFPGEPRDPVSWLFRDTHQGIMVRSSVGSARLFMDFMTRGGATAEVWWNEEAKWMVFLGFPFPGEVRIRNSGTSILPGSKLEQLQKIALTYDCDMNLYTNNCRMFCARMQREVERLNAEDSIYVDDIVADSRLALALLTSSMLPLLYPASLAMITYICLH